MCSQENRASMLFGKFVGKSREWTFVTSGMVPVSNLTLMFSLVVESFTFRMEAKVANLAVSTSFFSLCHTWHLITVHITVYKVSVLLFKYY